MPQFTLVINLGNEGMQTPGVVSAILAHFASVNRNVGFCPAGEHFIRDINGNVVGHYEVV